MGARGAKSGQGMQTSYAALYREHRARIEALCRLLLANPADAEEVAQEVFLSLYRQLGRDAREIVWGPWLTRVAINACRDRRRTRWWKLFRESSDELIEANHAATSPTPEEAVVNRELRVHVWSAFRRLPPRQREVFALRQLEGWSTEETAVALGVSTGSVKSHLSRAVWKMRGALGGKS